MNKPKGWYYRYELVRRPVQWRPNEPPKDWWCIVHYHGRGKSAGVRYLDGDPGPDIADDLLIRRADLDTVTVPVYVIRDGQHSDPYFSKFYGQK